MFKFLETPATLFRHRLNAMHRRAMMQSVVDNSFDGIAIVNQDGIIQVFNGAAEQILERRAVDVIGTPIHAYIPMIGAPGIPVDRVGDPDTRPQMNNDRGYREFTLVRDDGCAFVIELVESTSKLSITNSPLERRTESRIVHIYTFRNITERKRTEEAQKIAMEEASAANRAKTEFLANMSHELRTPLNAVIGFSEVVKSQPFGPLGAPQYLDYMEDIRSSGQHLLAIINDILDMSKIEAGEVTLIEDVINFNDITSSCMRLVGERAEKGNVEISIDVSDDLPWLRADERMVKQMVLNLLTNAVKFTPEGGRITVRAEKAPDGCFVITVSDTGIGISPQDMDAVLRPFGQADGSLQRQFDGTGLGLPLVKAMAELHGAELVLDSTVGVGTTASLRFPDARITSPGKHIAA